MNFESLKSFFKPSEQISQNRLDVLKTPEKLPSYILFGRNIRNKLKETVKEGWPKAPEKINNVDDFSSRISQTVTEKWQEKSGAQNLSVIDLIEQRGRSWLAAMSEEQKQDYPEIVELLTNPLILEEKLKLQKLDVLEPLKKILPDAWKTIAIISSERQLAQIALAKRWLGGMPESAFQGSEFNKEELTINVDLAALVGKLIDHAYLKQGELSYLNNGSKNNNQGKAGHKYLYTIINPENGQTEAVPFAKVFTFELQRFKKDMEYIAKKVEGLTAQGKLSQDYQLLPDYLQQLAATYCSMETDIDKLYEQWKNLYQKNAVLLESGCPQVINPQEDAPMNVVGLEMRLGLRSKNLQQLEKQSQLDIAVALKLSNKIIKENPQALAQLPPSSLKVFFNHQLFAFGPNLLSKTLAESYHNEMFIHTNEITKTAQKVEVPLLKKLFGDLPMSEAEYSQAALLETGRHEIAHQIMPLEDEVVLKRIGESHEANALEELKAETVSMKLVTENMEKLSDTELETILIAKLGTMLNYLINKSSEQGSEGESYYLCGAKIIHELLSHGLIKFDGQKITLENPQAAIKAIAEIGDNILDIYQNDKTKPATIRKYVEQLRKEVNTLDIQQLAKQKV